MIIENGTIEVKSTQYAGGVDPITGYAVKPTTQVWGKPIPCQYRATAHDWQAQTGGESVTRATYTILIELQAVTGEQIRLSDKSGNVVGEYSILSIEPLEGVCQVKILV